MSNDKVSSFEIVILGHVKISLFY